MQISRLFEIVYLLLNRKNVTAKELAERFEVSQRTIYRDIETLSQAGIPIYTSKGKGGGIALMEHFVLDKSVLSEQEQKAILAALQGMHATRSSEEEAVLSKLSALFGAKEPSWIQVDFSDWSGRQQEWFSLIRRAILQRIVVTFDYYSSYGERTHRAVEPLQLWFKEKKWYLIAFCQEKQAWRTFKLSRMKELQITDSHFSERPVWKEEAPVCAFDRDAVTVTLWVDASQAYRVYDEFEETEVVRQEDGSFLVTVTYPEDDWVYGQILSYGPYAKVLEPLRVREIIRGKLQKTLEAYR